MRIRLVAEQRGFNLIDFRRTGIRPAEDLLKVPVDLPIVVKLIMDFVSSSSRRTRPNKEYLVRFLHLANARLAGLPVALPQKVAIS